MNQIITICPSCATKNRIPPKHLADTGRCGKCKSSLPPAHEPIEVDDEMFDAITSQARVPVLVDFWAEWCGPCRTAAPQVHQLAQAMSGKALILKVDTESHPRLAARFGVQSIPNFVVLRDGQAVFQRAGVASAADMQRWLENAATR